MSGEEGVKTVDGRMCVYAGKKSNVHASTVVGDTVGDPLKDTSGPALNIVMKVRERFFLCFIPCHEGSACGRVQCMASHVRAW